jgi:intracellular sulfur oxidation DsrE/DsrF family protein
MDVSRLQQIVITGTTSATILLVGASLSAAQEAAPSAKLSAEHPPQKMAIVTKQPRLYRASEVQNRSVAALKRQDSAAKNKEHRLILQVNSSDPAAMVLALNNAMNVVQYYKDLGEKIEIEVITFGPGLHMLRADTSPVKDRIETMALSTPEVSFKACGNTQEKMRKAENKDIPLVPVAQVVNSGVVRIMELEERNWTYVKP